MEFEVLVVIVLCIPHTVYGESLAVDLILLFSWVYAPIMKLITAKISFSNPHTSTSSITAVAIHVEASNSMHFHVNWACDSSLLRARELGSEIHEI